MITSRKPVPKASITLHETTCFSRNIICPKCNKVVEKRGLEAHMRPVPCECGMDVEQCLLEDHKKNQCLSRKITCKYCSFQTKAMFMEEHESVCGDRTELCVKCNHYIKRRELAIHEGCNIEKINYYICPFCGIDELNEEEFVQHYTSSHSTENGPIVCPVCLLKGNSEMIGNFTSHMQVIQPLKNVYLFLDTRNETFK